MHHYRWPTQFGQIMAGVSTAPKLQEVAVARHDLRSWACSNPNLNHQTWWKLATGPRLKVDDAANLYRRKLDPEQRAQGLKDKRITVLTALISSNTMTAEELQPLVDSPSRGKFLTSTLIGQPRTPITIIDQIIDEVHVWHWMRCVLSNELITTQWVLDQLNGPRRRRIADMASWGLNLDKALDLYPGLVPGLLKTLSSPEWKPREAEVLLTRLTAARDFPNDGWQTVQQLIGADPRHSQKRTEILCNIVGNPNTGIEGVTWARNLLTAWEKVIAEHLAPEVERVLHARENAADPVTGDWDSPLPESQERTLQALRVTGRCWYAGRDPRAGTREENRTPPTHLVDPEPEAHAENPLATPSRSTPGVRTWHSEYLEWSNSARAAAHEVDRLLNSAETDVWQMLLTLAPEWEGDIRSLVNASQAM